MISAEYVSTKPLELDDSTVYVHTFRYSTGKVDIHPRVAANQPWNALPVKDQTEVMRLATNYAILKNPSTSGVEKDTSLIEAMIYFDSLMESNGQD